MKKLVAAVLILAFALPSFAIVEGDQVQYVGGTVAGMKNDTMGTFDTTQPDALVFNHDGGKLAIPYDKITNYRYEEKLARHYGVILTLLIVPFKYRQRRHFIYLWYTDDKGVAQSATFEVPKDRPTTLVPILEARVKRDSPQPRIAYHRPNS